jgi:DNA helicase-2/ATP-dependent DNA helicase PcrA
MDQESGVAAKTYHLKNRAPVVRHDLQIDYKNLLNPQQFAAATTTDGATLVIAGAGSGKTRTLVYRVSYLVETGVAPEQILLLTFTRKSAHELMHRASLVLDDRCRAIQGGTFHSFASLQLRRHAARIGYLNRFSILDRGDSEDILNLVRSDLGFGGKERRFPKKNTVLNIISKSVNTGKTIEQILDLDYPQFLPDSPDIQKLATKFTEFKRAQSLMDYDDLLVNFRMLLEQHPHVRDLIASSCRYIMIDEYQDTNRLQADIAIQLASVHGNVMVVGDDSQSIYSFRGANFRNIMDFPKLFPGAKVLMLEQNYRSTQPILNFTNAIIKNAEEKYSKTLFSEITGEQKPVLIRPSSLDEQSNFISQRILELREEGVGLDQIAVLFRSGWHSNELEVELSARNLPFVKYGGLRFVETAHVKDLISFARIIYNPYDTISWYRVLMLLEGVGPKSGRLIAQKATEDRLGFEALAAKEFSKQKFAPQLRKLHETLNILTSKEVPVVSQVKSLLEFYAPLLKSNYDDFRKRQDDLDSLIRIAERYESLETFLTDVTLDPPDSSQFRTDPEDKDEEKLTLSTIHSAKGLEWHTVFIISLIDGYLPASQSLHTNEEIEEERRLFYVAATRAKANLYLIVPEFGKTRGLSYFNSSFAFSNPSRFLGEIGAINSLTESWNLSEDDVTYDHNPPWEF